MANTKTNKKPTTQKVTKTVDTKVSTKESEEVIALKQQIEELKKAMAQLASAQPVVYQDIQPVNSNEEKEVLIGCRVIQGLGWGDPSDSAGEVRLRFGEEQSITVSDMKKHLRLASVRQLFVNGLCYFADPKDYEEFKIKNYIDLSSESLNNILSNKDINTIITELERLTDHKKNSSIINCLIFRICDMIMKSELSLDYYIRKAIEEYFDFEFDRGINTLRMLSELKK